MSPRDSRSSLDPAPYRADLVMEGGGVKGMAFAGAIEVLAEAGYWFPRTIGTSAGAITGALVAAMQRAGEPLTRLPELAGTLDLSKVTDSGWVGRALGPLHSIADIASLIFDGGMYEGDYLRSWVRTTLADLGVRTFADLRRDDPASALGTAQEYSLIVVSSDLSSRRMAMFPWDYAHYGLDPDEQSVAEAVCASAAIPVIFEPELLETPHGQVSLVDGGLLSNYPIHAFDQEDRTTSRWPTIGIRLSARESARRIAQPVDNAIDLARALVETALHGVDSRHIDDPRTIARTMFVDTSGVGTLDFNLADADRDQLVQVGRDSATRFLAEKSPYPPG